MSKWNARVMGLFDTVVMLDEEDGACCPQGHRLDSWQTKELDEPSMNTYLVRGGRLYLAQPQHSRGDEDASSWRFEGHRAVREHRFNLKLIEGPRSVRVYGTCHQCPPVLVRTDSTTWFGDLVDEREVFVDLLLTFRPCEPLQVERTSGTRDELKQDLRARGLYVLEDHEALAVAHQEVKRARERSGRSTRW